MLDISLESPPKTNDPDNKALLGSLGITDMIKKFVYNSNKSFAQNKNRAHSYGYYGMRKMCNQKGIKGNLLTQLCSDAGRAATIAFTDLFQTSKNK